MTVTTTGTVDLAPGLRPALEAYVAVERPAWEAYVAVERQRPAWEAYLAVKRPAWEALAATSPAGAWLADNLPDYAAEITEVIALLPASLDALDAHAAETRLVATRGCGCVMRLWLPVSSSPWTRRHERRARPVRDPRSVCAAPAAKRESLRCMPSRSQRIPKRFRRVANPAVAEQHRRLNSRRSARSRCSATVTPRSTRTSCVTSSGVAEVTRALVAGFVVAVTFVAGAIAGSRDHRGMAAQEADVKRKEAPFHDQLIRAVAYADDLDRLTERVNALEAAAKPQTSTATDGESLVPRRKGAVIRCRVADDHDRRARPALRRGRLLGLGDRHAGPRVGPSPRSPGGGE